MKTMRLDWRQKQTIEARRICRLAIEAVLEAAKAAGLEAEGFNFVHKPGVFGPPSARIGEPAIYVSGAWTHHWNDLRTRLLVGDYGKQRAYPIKADGSVNTNAIIDRIRALIAARKEQERQWVREERQHKEDEALYSRLSKLDKALPHVRLECKHGLTSVIASGLGEEEAKRVLSSLAEVLRPAPAVGEVWRHRKVQMPSRIVSIKGSVKLEGLDNHKLCSIPKREFLDDWELMSAAPEEPAK